MIQKEQAGVLTGTSGARSEVGCGQGEELGLRNIYGQVRRNHGLLGGGRGRQPRMRNTVLFPSFSILQTQVACHKGHQWQNQEACSSNSV